MLALEATERDGHLILVATDEDVVVDDVAYSDWTAVNSIMTTKIMMEVHMEAAKVRLTNRYNRFVREHVPPSLKKLGRVAVGPVIVIQDVAAGLEPGERDGLIWQRKAKKTIGYFT